MAVAAYGMPVGLALLSATEGAVFGLFPIMWIVFTAIWLYQLTVVSGRFEDLRAAFHLISDDPRVPGDHHRVLLRRAAGGTGRVRRPGGDHRRDADGAGLLRRSGRRWSCCWPTPRPVAFGAIGTPIITAGTLTGIPYQEIGAYVGRQTPMLAFIVPLLLVLLVDGARGVRQTWPVALAVGITFAVAQFVASNYLSVELTDIIAALAGPGRRGGHAAGVDPAGRRGGRRAAAQRARGDGRRPGTRDRDETALGGTGGDRRGARPAPRAGPSPSTPPASPGGRLFMAFFPYLLVIAVFSLAKLVAAADEGFLAGDAT